MHSRMPHEIYTGESIEEMRDKNNKPLIAITPKEVEILLPMSPDDRHKWMRKNRNRNRPCPCGSGKKFKKCCW